MNEDTNPVDELLLDIVRKLKAAGIDPMEVYYDAMAATVEEPPAMGLAAKSNNESPMAPALFAACDELPMVDGMERLFVTDGTTIYFLLFDDESPTRLVFDGIEVPVAIISISDSRYAKLLGLDRLGFLEFVESAHQSPGSHSIQSR